MPTQKNSEIEQLRDEVARLGSQLEAQRQEVAKLSQVITEVVGTEFDTIMNSQQADQRSTLRWVSLAMSLSIATLRELAEHGSLDEDAVRARVSELRERLISHAESLGSDPDIEVLFGGPRVD